MSMTKRYLESLPEEKQNAILGNSNQDEAEYWAANDADCRTDELRFWRGLAFVLFGEVVAVAVVIYLIYKWWSQ